MDIQSILNPVSDDCFGKPQLLIASSRDDPSHSKCETPPVKRQRLAKDAAIFTKGRPRGRVRFPPYEAGEDSALAAQHRKYHIHPMGNISDYHRHIPYNSEKKTFLTKTGRDCFEVFQYEFKVPGEDKVYTVMWDYNIGLVRVTPFFKCCQYSKTTPAKVLNLNPGLRDISHSITGGALAAQGYWMPYEAAKAVAATFAYEIRYALTPVFGKTFITMCTRPGDPNFENFKIAKRVISSCTKEANQWRYVDDRPSDYKSPTPDSAISSPKKPLTSPKMLDGKLTKRMDVESGYGTDTDSDKYYASPESQQKSYIGDWTPRNRVVALPATSAVSCSRSLQPIIGMCDGTTRMEIKREDAIKRDDGQMTDALSRHENAHQSTSRILSHRETKAAYALMQLIFADSSLNKYSRDRNRKAYL